jgi:hypothetical protein
MLGHCPEMSENFLFYFSYLIKPYRNQSTVEEAAIKKFEVSK